MADEADSKSVVGNHVRVQVPLPAVNRKTHCTMCDEFFIVRLMVHNEEWERHRQSLPFLILYIFAEYLTLRKYFITNIYQYIQNNFTECCGRCQYVLLFSRKKMGNKSKLAPFESHKGSSQGSKEDNYMAKRGENIRKRKDGRWEGRYPKGKKDGKTVIGSVFGKTYQETKEKLVVAKNAQSEKMKTAVNRQSDALESDFARVAEEWMEFIKPTLKKSSISKYRSVMDKHLLPEFGERKVVEITRADVMAFSTRLLASGGRNGKGLAPKTVSSIISVLKNVMDYVRRVKCEDVIVFDGLIVRQTQKQFRVFSTFEQDILSGFLLEEITPIKLGILLCLYTGLRIGEICALKWRDISFDEKKLHVARTLQRIQEPDGKGHKTQILIEVPKSDCSIRDIPIPDEIFDILVAMRQPDCCFFLTGLEETFVEPRTLENHFSRFMEACGIRNATVHTCRHSFATRCMELGFDIKTLSEILGHASVAITMNRYVHPSMALKRQNMNKLSGVLSGVRKKECEEKKSL